MQLYALLFWLRVLSCDEKYKEILGLKLVSINSVSVDKVISKASTTYSYDNEQGAKEIATRRISVNVKKKPGRKSAFDKCKETYLNGQIQGNMLK